MHSVLVSHMKRSEVCVPPPFFVAVWTSLRQRVLARGHGIQITNSSKGYLKGTLFIVCGDAVMTGGREMGIDLC